MILLTKGSKNMPHDRLWRKELKKLIKKVTEEFYERPGYCSQFHQGSIQTLLKDTTSFFFHKGSTYLIDCVEMCTAVTAHAKKSTITFLSR